MEPLALMLPITAGETDLEFVMVFIHSHIWVLSMFTRLLPPPNTLIITIIHNIFIFIFTITAFCLDNV